MLWTFKHRERYLTWHRLYFVLSTSDCLHLDAITLRKLRGFVEKRKKPSLKKLLSFLSASYHKGLIANSMRNGWICVCRKKAGPLNTFSNKLRSSKWLKNSSLEVILHKKTLVCSYLLKWYSKKSNTSTSLTAELSLRELSQPYIQDWYKKR